MRIGQAVEKWEVAGCPFGMIDNAPYEERAATLSSGDCLLLLSDGAIEVQDANRKMLGVDGLVRLLEDSHYPQTPLQMDGIEEELLKYSNAIRLEDDLTFLEFRFC
jgi:sigma-B regulation protein RsbU (phosphoserine phosphatase)